MKNNKLFVVGMLVIILPFWFVLVGCNMDTGGNNEEMSNEKVFADVWAYFGCPEAHNWTDNEGLTENTGFRFYNESYTATNLNAVKAYWDSLPDNKTYYDTRWAARERDWFESNLFFELQLHRGEDGNTWFQIEINYPDGSDYLNDGLQDAVPGKVLKITQGMVNCLSE
jgi:hypothetical protein